MKKRKIAFFFLLLFVCVLSFSSVCSAGWKKSKGKYRYYVKATGEYVCDEWKKIGKKWYYFNASGYLKTGRFKLGDNYYYVKKSTGRLVNKKVGSYYYGKDGAMVKNSWVKIKKHYFYFGANGKLKTGRFTPDGTTYYYIKKTTGRVTKKQVGNYYYGADGKMITNDWGGKFYFGNDGKVVYGKILIDGQTYCCVKKSGKVVNRWYKGNFYDKNGVMAVSQWIGSGKNKCYVDEKGEISEGNQNPKDPPTEKEIRMLAALTYWEAGNQPYQGKLAVASVVINRLESKKFPNTLKGVIFQSGQFTPAMDGRVTAMCNSKQKIQSECVKAAKTVLTEGSKYKGYYYFNGAYGTLKIGDHYFS